MTSTLETAMGLAKTLLERHGHKVATGGVVLLGFDGTADLAIAIARAMQRPAALSPHDQLEIETAARGAGLL